MDGALVEYLVPVLSAVVAGLAFQYCYDLMLDFRWRQSARRRTKDDGIVDYEGWARKVRRGRPLAATGKGARPPAADWWTREVYAELRRPRLVLIKGGKGGPAGK